MASCNPHHSSGRDDDFHGGLLSAGLPDTVVALCFAKSTVAMKKPSVRTSIAAGRDNQAYSTPTHVRFLSTVPSIGVAVSAVAVASDAGSHGVRQSF